MPLHPTHRNRTPYILHFGERTVALGEPKFLADIYRFLKEEGFTPTLSYWDQAYFDRTPEEFLKLLEVGEYAVEEIAHPHLINSVGVELEREEFWEVMNTGIFKNTPWPVGNAPVYVPELPNWLLNARSWEYDPILPADGVAQMGGWDAINPPSGSGYPLGLFQLTSAHAFWVLGSANDLDAVMDLCRDVARDRTGFDQVTGYLGSQGRYTCILLPIICRSVLEEELFLKGVDVESVFWD